MKLYRLTLQPHGSFRTPLQSDTIFGHLMWACRYVEREAGLSTLRELLARYQAGEPPFLVSAGFPADHLPLPSLPRPKEPAQGPIADRVVADMVRKRQEKWPYLALQAWPALARNFSAAGVRVAQQATPPPSRQDPWAKDHSLTHTAVDRISGSARDGQLFVAEETFYRETASFDVWHKVADESLLPKLERWWQWIADNGFGKRKSTGTGNFSVTRCLEAVDETLFQVPKPNAFMSLSAWVPAQNDPTQVTYKTRVKRGKLGEQLALPNPWKKPLLMLEPGAVAEIGADSLRAWYGQVVPNIHWTEPEVVQYGLAFPVPINWVASYQRIDNG